ncbi:NFIL3 like protein-like [Amphibalanus amphitrite]|nr:NFIL3 like protein-like [Amphibalanus amphitrite]
MVAETLLSSVQLAGLKSRFGAVSPGYFNYPPPGGAVNGGRPSQGAPVSAASDAYPVSPLELPASLQCDMFSQRKQREFIPDNKKDESYWDRRRRNNEAAKRSREKRRLTDMVLESRVFELTKENHLMRAQLAAIRDKFGIVGENLINHEQVLSQLPAMDQVLSFTKRHKPLSGQHMMPLPAGGGGPAPGPGPFMGGAAPPPPPPPPSSAPASPPAPAPSLLFRQQSMRELREPEPVVCDYSRPRSAEPEHQQTPPPPPAPLEATNLSRSAIEPRPMHSTEGGVLPLKLRHKTLLCDREAAAAGLLGLTAALKEEPHDSAGSEAASSGDERDSGLSDRSASCDGADEPARKRLRAGSDASSSPPPQASGQIRCELERLAKEVATLKCLLNHRDAGSPPMQPEA